MSYRGFYCCHPAKNYHFDWKLIQASKFSSAYMLVLLEQEAYHIYIHYNAPRTTKALLYNLICSGIITKDLYEQDKVETRKEKQNAANGSIIYETSGPIRLPLRDITNTKAN